MQNAECRMGEWVGGGFRVSYGGTGGRVRPLAERFLVGPQGRRYTWGNAAVIDRRYKAAEAAVGCYLSIHGAIVAWAGKRGIRTVGTK
jgi:hypothetical protein